jgi:flavin reductase (DIM6/NTAB) family NADH-FMN oxidoreductase RutF
MPFKPIKATDFPGNPVQLIGYDWMLITAGNIDHFNTMTAAWGGLGFLWKKPMATIFIRPQRYTYEFTEKYREFTLSFFDKEYLSALQLCGTKSGRDMDKVKEAGLTPLVSEHGNIYFEEARLVIECEKVYYDDINPGHFIDTSIEKNYPLKDYHRMYIGFIINCLVKTG